MDDYDGAWLIFTPMCRRFDLRCMKNILEAISSECNCNSKCTNRATTSKTIGVYAVRKRSKWNILVDENLALG